MTVELPAFVVAKSRDTVGEDWKVPLESVCFTIINAELE
jgi:hypothetical protein